MARSIQIVQDVDQAIAVMRDAGKWMAESGKNPPHWWEPQNLTRKVLFQYAPAEDFYVALIDEKPAAAMILTESLKAQSWEAADKGPSPRALYIHWLAVHRDFRTQGLPKVLVEFAMQKAKDLHIGLVRLDTNAEKPKLMQLYEKLGFQLVTIVPELSGKTAYFQKTVDV